MQIDRFEFYPNNNYPEPTVLGLNIQKKFGITNVNMFALEDNKGELISHNLWNIIKQICKEIFMGERPENMNWSLRVGYNETAIRFSTLNGTPHKIDFSNVYAAEWENHPSNKFSIEKYESLASKKAIEREIEYPQKSKSIFSIPCNHPDAKDGVFHCVPSHFNSDKDFSDDYEFILVDTKKIIAQLKKDDPLILDHAERKFSGDTAAQWLKSTSIEHPRDMGMWTYSFDRGLSFCSGQAGIIKLVQELDLPYFPIAVPKNCGNAEIKELVDKIGYGGKYGNQRPVMESAPN